jgi:hypothetical protein
MVIKKSQTTSKASAKKNISGRTTKPAKKTEIKKTLRDTKQPQTKLSRKKPAAKTAVTKTGSEMKKLKRHEIKTKKKPLRPATG